MVDLMIVRGPGCMAAKQIQVINPLLSLTVGTRCLCCLVFSVCGAVYYSQACPLWSDLSKGNCFRTLVTNSDATLQT